MMKKGFTLVELVVVIIILGVLATLGITQYGKMVERMRNAEAIAVMGDIRKLIEAYYLENGTVSGITNANVNIGTASDQIPSACTSSHYYGYDGADLTSNPPYVRVRAFRCTSGGKFPDSQCEYNIYMIFNPVSGDVNFGCSGCGRSWTGFSASSPIPCP